MRTDPPRYISTGGDRLDSLIGGDGKGFRYTLDAPVSICIKGRAGTGKSILASQIANRCAGEQRGFCIYYALDISFALSGNQG